jgi:2-phospho-L-lactate transferase/gluconeogenesis factor (CofD/UPF0052 family)
MKFVAVGGGHGTAVSLRALKRLSANVTGVVSVADDGGSGTSASASSRSLTRRIP